MKNRDKGELWLESMLEALEDPFGRGPEVMERILKRRRWVIKRIQEGVYDDIIEPSKVDSASLKRRIIEDINNGDFDDELSD